MRDWQILATAIREPLEAIGDKYLFQWGTGRILQHWHGEMTSRRSEGLDCGGLNPRVRFRTQWRGNR